MRDSFIYFVVLHLVCLRLVEIQRDILRLYFKSFKHFQLGYD